MDKETRCIECGGEVVISHPNGCDQYEECTECGRRSRWRVCMTCGEINGPRRAICLECGLPFERQTMVYARSAARQRKSAAKTRAVSTRT